VLSRHHSSPITAGAAHCHWYPSSQRFAVGHEGRRFPDSTPSAMHTSSSSRSHRPFSPLTGTLPPIWLGGLWQVRCIIPTAYYFLGLHWAGAAGKVLLDPVERGWPETGQNPATRVPTASDGEAESSAGALQQARGVLPLDATAAPCEVLPHGASAPTTLLQYLPGKEARNDERARGRERGLNPTIGP